MKKKLATLRKLQISSKNFTQNTENKKLFKSVQNAYFNECILKGKDNFQIVFKGKYIDKFPERMYDWVIYGINSLYRLYLLRFTPNDDTTFKKYELLHYGVRKPLHIIVRNTPNENLLELFLKENGFKIVDEHLDNVNAIYDIAKI